jgi:hypothetical protein
MNKTAVIATIKELVRLAIFGAVSGIIVFATHKLSSLDPNSAYAVAGTFILQGADKYVHKNENIQANGILPF